MKPPSQPTFFDEYANLIVPGAAVIAGGLLYVLHDQGMVSESMAGTALAATVGLVCASTVWTAAHAAAKTSMDRNLGSLFAALTLLVAAGLATLSLRPGTPLVESELLETGQVLMLPESASGPLRVLVHGDLGGEEEATVNFTLSGADQPLNGHLVRKISVSRSRKGMRSRAANEVNSTYLHLSSASGGKPLTLTSLNGPLKGGLHVAVFRDWVPVGVAYGVALAFVLVAAVVSVKKRWKDTALLAMGLAGVFGLVVNLNGTPDAAVRAEIGALFVGFFLGGIGGIVLGWLVKKAIGDSAGKPAVA